MVTKLVIIAIYFGLLILLGILASRRIRDESDYIVGGKKLGFWLVSFSSRATGESAWLILGLTGLAYKLGIVALWVVLGEVIGVSICWLLMTKPFKRLTDRYNSSTVPDYLTGRVHTASMLIRWLSAIALTVFVAVYVSAQFHATGKAFDGFLGVQYHTGVALGFSVVLAYIVTGGFIAVVWSDLFQGVMMLLALVALPIYGLVTLGGPGQLFTILAQDNAALLNWFGPGGFSYSSLLMVIGLVAVGVGYLGSPQVFVRFISVKDTKELDRGTWVAIGYTLLVGLGAVFTGLCARAIFFTSDKATWLTLAADNFAQKEKAFTFMANIFPDLISGTLIAVVLCAIMSTADSLLILASSSLVHDTWKKISKKELDERSLTRLSRYATFGIATAALVMTYIVATIYGTTTSIYWYVIFGWSGIAATFVPVIILSLVWRGLTMAGTAAGMISGFLSVILLKALSQLKNGLGRFLVNLDDVLLLASLIAMLAAIVVSLVTRIDRNLVDGDFDYLAKRARED